MKPDNRAIKRACKLCILLANPQRMRIAALLQERGTLSLEQIASALRRGAMELYYPLNIMRAHGLITHDRPANAPKTGGRVKRWYRLTDTWDVGAVLEALEVVEESLA